MVSKGRSRQTHPGHPGPADNEMEPLKQVADRARFDSGMMSKCKNSAALAKRLDPVK